MWRMNRKPRQVPLKSNEETRWDSMLNPGYRSKTAVEKPEVDAGPVILCPNCRKPLMEGVAERFLTRCKHCRKWIYLEKS